MNLAEQPAARLVIRQERKFGQPDTITIRGTVCCDTKAVEVCCRETFTSSGGYQDKKERCDMETTTTLYIDVRNPGIMQTIYAVQYDSGRLLRCMISGMAKTISKARIYCKKPSGSETYTEGTVISNYCVLFSLTPQMVAEVGNTECQLHLIDGSNAVTSFKVKMEVRENLVAASEIQSTNEYQALVDILNRLEKYDPIEITTMEIILCSQGP